MSKFSRILPLLLALAWAPALACDLDDCTLSDALHQATAAPAPLDGWSWMNHDLAVARDALTSGERARTLALVQDLDGLLRTHLSALLEARGKARVRAFHLALQTLSQQAGGWPLAELLAPAAGAQG